MKKANAQRIETLIAGIAKFGKNPSGHGVSRLAYTPEDFAAEEWLFSQLQDLNLEITHDAIGNAFLRRKGEDNTLAPIAMGSHLDTVLEGGNYDGVAGVIAAVEVLYMLKDASLKRPLEVIIFRCEESSRFGLGTLGSKIMAGVPVTSELCKAQRKNDLCLEEAIKASGYDLKQAAQVVKAAGAYEAFFELHIEQGNILDTTGEKIGIVENIAAPTRFKITLTGEAGHSGATPMNLRKDALVAGAKAILAIEKAAKEELEHGTVATVGVLEVEPSSINVIPGKVTLWVDVRGVAEKSRQRTLHSISSSLRQIGDEQRVIISEELLTEDAPVALSKELGEEFAAICKDRGISHRLMNSGAGHDAMNMATICPTSMLFIPCAKGISHNPKESALLADICLGAEVLAEMVERKANA